MPSLKSFLELRHRVFVQRLGWALQSKSPIDGLELDEFDDDEAVYMVVPDINGKVIAGLRLLPTTGRYLLASHFSSFVEGPLPRDPGVFEISRFVVDPRCDDQVDGGDVVKELIWGLQSYGRAARLSRYVSLSYIGIERLVRASGCCFRRLGRPQEIDGRKAVAIQFDIGPQIQNPCQSTLANLGHASGRISDRATVRLAA